jgi:hypothetical protein
MVSHICTFSSAVKFTAPLTQTERNMAAAKNYFEENMVVAKVL